MVFEKNIAEYNVQKKVGEFMGGKVLDLPEFKIYAEGKAEGKAEGLVEGKAEGENERQNLKDKNLALKNRIAELEKRLSV